MSALASRFADKDGDDEVDDDDASSFEEVQKPVERPTRQETKSSVQEPKPQEAGRISTTTEPVKQTLPEEPSSSGPPAGAADETPTNHAQAPTQESAPASQPQPQPSASAAAGGLRDVLQEIRGMLQTQGRQIEHLASEVAQLKAKVGQ
ncbi:Coronin-like protein crn1 [Teratosphaeriaceae sp. CCFEE 6253]|nr:Coronin-like protein crn1 [Teratosphaeriaceae sp. CCFEE 6253]